MFSLFQKSTEDPADPYQDPTVIWLVISLAVLFIGCTFELCRNAMIVPLLRSPITVS